MERLGHSDVTVTLNVHGHLLPSLEEQLTDGLDELYPGDDRRRRSPRPASRPATSWSAVQTRISSSVSAPHEVRPVDRPGLHGRPD